jgi:hypothetical protein
MLTGQRIVVCVGQLGLRAGYSRFGGEEAMACVWREETAVI